MEVLNADALVNRNITTAIIDFDGTISTLRANWEEVMRKLMLAEIHPEEPYPDDLVNEIDAYIHESTGIQTAYQMEWLHNRVIAEGKNPEANHRDIWWYKDAYNAALIKMVNERIDEAHKSPAHAAKFRIPGSLEFCQTLHSLGIKIYVASGTDHDDVVNEARILGLEPYVSEIRGAPTRAFTDAKRHVLSKLLQDNKPEELLMVGDGKVEIALGQEAGALTLGVATDEAYPYRIEPAKHERLVNAGADIIVPNFLDQQRLLSLIGL